MAAAMAASTRPLMLSCGLRGSCKSARYGLGFPAGATGPHTRSRMPRPFLPPDLVRVIDTILRRMEREEILLSMHEGNVDRTLIDAARASGLLDVRFLLSRGADAAYVHIKFDVLGGQSRSSALYGAAWNGNLEVARALVDAAGAGHGELFGVALDIAAMDSRTDVALLLLDRGASLNAEHCEMTRWCAKRGNLVLMRNLLARGAEVGEAELRIAREHGKDDMVRLLLEHGG